MALEMVPLQTRGLVPAGVVEQEKAAFAGLGRDGFGELIQKALEAIGVHGIEDHGKALAGARTDCPHDIGADVIAKVGDARSTPSRRPAPARARIAFHATFIGIPQFDLWLQSKGGEALEKSCALGFILALGPALWHAQIVIELVQVADDGAIAQLHAELLF